MSEPLIFVRWKTKDHNVREGAKKAQNMKRVQSAAADEWAKLDIELYELPPGLAKKSAEWLIEKGWAEAEVDGEGEGIPIDPDIGQAMSVSSLSAGAQWYQQRVGLPSAWMESTGAGKKLGVCDSGANHSHEWLKDSIVISKNFVANETTVHDNEGHGTATAGITKAVAKDSGLVIARVMSQNSAKWSALGAGIIWCADQGCVAINVSIKGSTDSWSLSSAISHAREKGCVTIVSAGNDGTDAKGYPAATVGAIAVSATDQSDNKAGFSQYGSHIKLTAPGVGLLTSYQGGYSSFSGTSGSAPIVTGCVGVVAAKYNQNGEDALQIVSMTARDLGNAFYFGAGIPDLIKALGYDPTDPEPPPPPPPPTMDKPATPFNLRVTDIEATSFAVRWDQTPYPKGIKKWEAYGGDYRFDSIEYRYGPRLVVRRAYGKGPKLKWIRVRAVGGDGIASDLSAYLDESLPPGESPPPPPPPVTLPTNVIASIATIEQAVPQLTTEQKVLLLSELNRVASKVNAG